MKKAHELVSKMAKRGSVNCYKVFAKTGVVPEMVALLCIVNGIPHKF